MKKIYIQCGEEHSCKNKECLKCPRKTKYNLTLTHAEVSVIEDFAVCDLKTLIAEKPKEVKLMQNVLIKTMNKIFKENKSVN
jgi:hypothetical protein